MHFSQFENKQGTASAAPFNYCTHYIRLLGVVKYDYEIIKQYR